MRKAEKRNLTKKEAKEKGIYVEGHHIFPKSIYGNNKRIVYLTGREHYFAHAVLERAFIQRYGLKDPKTIKMTHAHCRMIGNGIYINSRLYEEAKKRSIIIFKEKNKLKVKNNRVWWTNGEKNVKRVRCPGKGWYVGRTIFKKPEKLIEIDDKQTKKWWNNGEKNVRRVKCPGEGWIPGMIITENMGGKKLWNNGKEQKYSTECPGEGWILGELKSITQSRTWWTNGEETKRCKECPGEGWVRGHNFDRTSSKNIDQSNRKWWNNGVENQFTSNCPGEGWVRGILLKEKYYWWTNGTDNVYSPVCPEGEEWYRGMVRKPRKNK